MGLSKYIAGGGRGNKTYERKLQPEHKQATKQKHLSLRSKPFLHQLWPS
jgi:hypothetical protein